ncbi:NUDIX hydrolase [Desulfobacterium sp. N47]|uniref:NUDIX hydrolase n=1 Tax=Desulfobacterium sp. N47 TaxID=3115210 RepID=UPI003C9A602C
MITQFCHNGISIETDLSAITDIIRNADRSGLPPVLSYDSTCVFLLLFNKNNEPNILAIQKTDNEGYPWRNQVALPGGHVEKEDASFIEAAYRELAEELNIRKNQVELIGPLGHFQTINHKDIKVFTGIWKKIENIRFDPSEISRVIEIPLKTLTKTHIDSEYFGRIPDINELIYPIDHIEIWGVTARILHHFIELILKCSETVKDGHNV